jgi:response regulator RpfG family c-di-GMP phosphodiesterase
MKFLRKKSDEKPPSPPAPPKSEEAATTAPPKKEALKVNLPDIFAYEKDETKAKLPQKKHAVEPEEETAPRQIRGSIMLVESDDEVRRLISRLLEHEGFRVLKATCLAEARTMIKDVLVDFLLARRESVPLNLQTERVLREIESKTHVRIVDNFSELMLGQVVDYESMSQCSLALLDLLMSLLEGANVGARGHAHSVAKYCRLVAQRMGLSRRELDAITMAAYLHDLGALETTRKISEALLGKDQLIPPSLRPTLEILANISFPYNVNELLAAASDIQAAATDREKLASSMPIGARILRVADTYDTLRRAQSELQDEDSLFDWLRKQPTGTFDADVLETFIHIRKHERAISAMNIFWAAVLLVDSHPEDLQLLKLRLENDDFHVLIAKSVEEALRILRNENVSLVLSEHRLSGGNGFELLKAIKNDPALRHIPFVFHAAGGTDLIKQALELGAEDWLPKPHNVEIVAMKLNRIISRLHAEPETHTDGVHGNIRDMGLIEMVQILSAGGRSVQILLENNQTIAELVLQKGQIISAMAGEATGDSAVLEILRWRDGHFRILPLKETPTANVVSSTDNLLLQSCHAEEKPSQPQPPEPPARAGKVIAP